MNKKIATEFAIGIILLIAIILGGFIWLGNRIDNAPKTQIADDSQKISPQINTPSGAINPVPNEIEGWQTYRNEKYGFEIKYPMNWQIDLEFVSKKVISLYEKDAPRGFYGHPGYPVSINIFDNSEQLTIDQWIQKNTEDPVLSEKENVFIDRANGLKFISGGMAENQSVYFGKGKFVYHIMTDKNSDSLDIFNQILSTFKFIDSTDETADWQTYRNEKYGFEVKYPKNLTVREETNSFTEEKFIRFENMELNEGPRSDYLGYFISIYNKNNKAVYQEYLDKRKNEERNPVKNTVKLNTGTEAQITFYEITDRVSYDNCSTMNDPGCKYWDYILPVGVGFLEDDNYAYNFYISSPNENQEKELEYLRKTLSTFKFIN